MMSFLTIRYLRQVTIGIPLKKCEKTMEQLSDFWNSWKSHQNSQEPVD